METSDTGWPMESSCSAKLIVGGVNCSRLLCDVFDKVSDEIKPQNVKILTIKNKKFRSSRLEFQPSFIVKPLFITVLQSRGACFREQTKYFFQIW